MKNIIVPCDFSAPSLEAVRFAAWIARKAKGELTLVHCIALPTMPDTALATAFQSDYMHELKTTATNKLEKIQDKYAGSNVRSKVEISFGDVLFTLKKMTKSGKYDLVVMGTHGASGLKEFTIGSNAEKVVRNSTIPVITVRNAGDEINNIVFPVKPESDMEEFTMKVKELQYFLSAKLHVVFINTPATFKRDGETMPLLEKFAKRFMLRNYSLHIFSDISEEEGIRNFTRSIKGDLVAMGTHGRRGILHLASGSIAEDVVNHIECPVWTYKIK